jgi:hypothetical protein
MIRALVFAAGLAAFAAAPALAAGSFDGPWSVVIVTKKGDCDTAYRNTVTIDNGAINYAGGPAAPAGKVGMVTKAGAVKIAFKGDKGTLSASGRMTGGRGSGVWTASNGCAGVWKAEKRG